MTTAVQAFFKRIFILFMVVLLLINASSNAFAVSDLIIEADNILTPPENSVSSGTGNYTYSAPNGGDFLIRNAVGVISITDNVPTILFDNYSVTFPTFDYYRIVDTSGNTRFYQADVLKNPTQTNNFAYIGLYVEDGPTYSIHVQYIISVDNAMYNITAPLTQEQFMCFSEVSTDLCLGTDEVSQRLKMSGRASSRGVLEGYDYSEAEYENNASNQSSATTYALNSISENVYDSYTNSDGIINSYSNDYFGEYYLDDNYTITDDPIVTIVPKSLCFTLGEHIYIGKEYGFFIRVFVDTINPNDYAADIMVFDIIHTTPNFTTNETGAAKIKPLFQYRYRAAEPDSFASDVDPSLSRVVIPHLHYDYAEYFLKNVGVKFTLDNPTALNPGDSGYDPLQDNGAFMIQTRVNVSGVGAKKKNNSFVADTVLFTLGFVPIVGPAISVGSYVYGLYNGFGNNNYFYTRAETIENNELNISTLKTNSTDQIAAYGNLIKSQSITLDSDNDSPRLIHVGGGYVEIKYVIARKSGSSYNKIRITTSISVSVVEDNTSLLLGQEIGDIVDYGRATGTYETGSYKRLDNISLNGGTSATIPSNNQTNIIRIIPRVSGSYTLTTYGSYGDPNFRITNATTGATSILADDDIDGANNRNATLTVNLVAGNIYYLEAFRYGTPYTYTLRMGYTLQTTLSLTVDTPYSFTTTSDSYRIIKFTPSSSGNYSISTSRITGDPQLFLFSSTGALLDSDDDSGGSLNSLIEQYLIGGVTYYIAAQGFSGNAATFSITVTKQ